MSTWKYLQPIDTMERITRQFLADNFDTILGRVNEENIGFVILTPEGTDGQVLCPANWINYCFDTDFGCIITSAIRYAINRKTYMPGIVVDFVRKYLNVLDTNTIKVAIEDIEQELRFESITDPPMWIKLKDDLEKRLADLVALDKQHEDGQRRFGGED